VIQNSKESKLVYGADVAGAVFKEISDKIYARYLSNKRFTAPALRDTAWTSSYGMKSEWSNIFRTLNMPFVDSASGNGYWRTVSVKNNSALMQPSVNTASNVITPTLIGMGLKDAIYLAENKGLKVVASGKGKVVSQSLAAGAAYKKGQTITLVLN
jgi:cell division protein FtsI (penicillin-binding protein 3)